MQRGRAVRALDLRPGCPDLKSRSGIHLWNPSPGSENIQLSFFAFVCHFKPNCVSLACMKTLQPKAWPMTNTVFFPLVRGEILGTQRHEKRDLRIVVHAQKFQSLVIPNGLITNLYGSLEGRRHDAGMLNESGLLRALQAHAHTPTGVCIYGDPAYPLRPELMSPYRGDYAGPPRMRAFNSAMSSARISVEWFFGDISTYFQLIDCKKNLKIGMSAMGKQYIVCALVRNALTCPYGNNTSDYIHQPLKAILHDLDGWGLDWKVGCVHLMNSHMMEWAGIIEPVSILFKVFFGRKSHLHHKWLYNDSHELNVSPHFKQQTILNRKRPVS